MMKCLSILLVVFLVENSSQTVGLKELKRKIVAATAEFETCEEKVEAIESFLAQKWDVLKEKTGLELTNEQSNLISKLGAKIHERIIQAAAEYECDEKLKHFTKFMEKERDISDLIEDRRDRFDKRKYDRFDQKRGDKFDKRREMEEHLRRRNRDRDRLRKPRTEL